MILPSKELLSEVLKCGEVVDIYLELGFIHFTAKRGYLHDDSINLYELMHMMKEWALSENCYLKSFIYMNIEGNKTAECEIHMEGVYYNDNKADTEAEAVCQACEWILKESK